MRALLRATSHDLRLADALQGGYVRLQEIPGSLRCFVLHKPDENQVSQMRAPHHGQLQRPSESWHELWSKNCWCSSEMSDARSSSHVWQRELEEECCR